MRAGVAYGEPEQYRAATVARVLMEVAMYPHLMSQIAAEHIQDMRKQATETGRARQVRRARRGVNSRLAAGRLAIRPA
jgi:hypothetical protein